MSAGSSGQSSMGTVESMHRARSYQLEMLEQSLARNTIVAMDTGSGKTQIAILRIMEELERCSQDKLVWFLAPTVALCTQQHDAINLQLPAARTRLLIGSDNVDRWGEKRIWDTALSGVRIVVSTHAVLLDALRHGFVQITSLALLIFDEAHHCRRHHPANRIMQEFYHPKKLLFGPTSVPHILGLTASPAVKSKVSDLSVIETNLDSICRTPRIERKEMLKFVHRPVIEKLLYHPYNPGEVGPRSTALSLLRSICRTSVPEWGYLMGAGQCDIGTPLPSGEYKEQLIKFERKAAHIYEELGPWATDYFILESIKTFNESIDVELNFPLWSKGDEKSSLLRLLNRIPSRMSSAALQIEDDMCISAKVERLISFLANQDPERCSGLVFAKQRATVSVLNALLSRHSRTKNRFRCSTFVGLSNSAKRRYSMSELLDLKAQREALTEFKAKVKNLIIATDVLEEGIDVTACNLVVCFDVPPNLKSFLQRRGRARQEQSTFAILLARNDGSMDKTPLWQQLEEKMIRLYQDETRALHNSLAEQEEEPIENVDFEINVPSTGAKLTANGALGHLYHFCALLPRQPYVDIRPAFAIIKDPPTGLFTATVTLPNCINASIRHTKGCWAWETEKAAVKDAAFQAYNALFRAGLLSDHLLPLTHERVLAVGKAIDIPAVVEVSGQFDPWSELAKAWSSPDLHRIDVTLRQDSIDGGRDFEFSLTTPLSIPTVKPIKMYWDKYTTFTITLGRPNKIPLPEQGALEAMKEVTKLLHRSVHSDQYPDHGNDFVALFTPRIETRDIAKWLEWNRGRNSALDHFRAKPQIPCRGFVRTPSLFGRPYVFQRWCVHETPPQTDIVEVECVPLPRRRNFLHQATLSKRLPVHLKSSEIEATDSPETERFLVQDATVDLLAFDQAQFGFFIPGILQHMEVHLVAQKLCTTILSAVRFSNVGLVVTALSCPSAQWVTNYQRLEYIGDSVLKFIVSRQLFINQPSWHEGYLTQARANLISNNTLADAAIRVGLGVFIISEPARSGPRHFPRISNAESRPPPEERRSLSSKVLADVVEALIGAAYIEGGFRLALTCINIFLPNIHLQLPAPEIQALSSSGSIKLTNFVKKAENIIEYNFHNKGLLLESLTHPTCERDIHTESYQRLEFLGDAVLDMLVVSLLAKQNASQGEMTRIKAAVVNSHLLGFFCLELSIDEDVIVGIEEKPLGVFRSRVRREQLHLWKFMRSHNQEVTMAQERSLARCNQLRVDIQSALANGSSYPWVLLSRLNPEKFFSDIIESIIGAIFIDSRGDLAPCERFLERIGLRKYLRRVCAERVNVEHPRSALERLSGPDGLHYTVSCEGDAPIQSYHCTVCLDGEILAQVGGCLTKDEATTATAETAKQILVERRKSTAKSRASEA